MGRYGHGTRLQRKIAEFEMIRAVSVKFVGGYPVSVKMIFVSHGAVQQRVFLNLFRAVFPPMFAVSISG